MNPDIWIVTGISAEARSQARVAAERARMTPGAWVERAIRKSLFLDTHDKGGNPAQRPGQDHEVIRALAALEERLNRRPEWPANLPPESKTAAKTSEAPPPAEGEAKPAPHSGNAEGLAALAAEYPIPEEPTRRGPAPRVIALIVGVAITSAAAAALIHQSFQPTVVASSSTPAEPANRSAPAGPATSTRAASSLEQVHITAVESARSKLPNAEEAQSGLQLAAAAGDAQAQRRLGLLYATGGIGKVDGRRAAIWLHRSAAQGLPSASFYLGLIYDRGLGVPADRRKAFIYYRRAAQNGYAPAKHNLGVAFAEGRGAKQDYAMARKWFQAAAFDGIAASHFSMGLIYELGLGAEANPVEARQWYRTGANMGDDTARVRLDALASGSRIALEPGRFPQIAFEEEPAGR